MGEEEDGPAIAELTAADNDPSRHKTNKEKNLFRISSGILHSGAWLISEANTLLGQGFVNGKV